MRNEFKSKKFISLVGSLPYFSIYDIELDKKDQPYLKIFLSRHHKRGKLIRLKKGMYVTKEFINSLPGEDFPLYLEFIANVLYPFSYLSLEYVLAKHNALTEAPVNFTSVSRNKTISFQNELGNFFYHKIKDELFWGFKVVRKGKFYVCEATKAKALFDFLYLRKKQIMDEKAIEELRINVNVFDKNDRRKIDNYLKIEKSKKLKYIFDLLFKNA